MAFFCSHDDSSAGFNCWVFIHEVEKEYFLEGVTWDCCDGLCFCDEILVFELVFSVPLYVFEEGFGEGNEIEEIHEFFKRLGVVF